MADLKTDDQKSMTTDTATLAASARNSQINEKINDSDSTGKSTRPASANPEKAGSVRSEVILPETDGETSEDEIVYPTKGPLAMITLALCLVVFLIALDQTIIATAIPRITDQFDSIGDIGWYGSAYMLTTCSFQLIFGKIYTFFSLKWCFIGAVMMFELGSLICGVAPSSTALIVGRAIAGLGAAGIFSGAIIILTLSVPLEQRPIYTGLVGGMFGIASVAGPLLGGVFTDSRLTWRWCFYINLPIGAVTLAVIAIFFKPPARKKVDRISTREKLKHFDFIGTGLLIPCIVCLLLALQWGGSTYKWSNWRIIFLFVMFALLATGFGAMQVLRPKYATLPPRIIKQRSIAWSALLSLCVGSAFFILVFYVPLWFQAVKGVTPTQSGIRNIPLILSVTIFSILSGGLVTVIGYYTPFMIAGPAIGAIGAGLLTLLNERSGPGMWIGFQIIAGAGVGLCMQLPMIAAQTVLTMDDVPTGTAVIIFAQTLGGALFISVGQNVLSNQFIRYTNLYQPGYDAHKVLSGGATNLREIVPPEFLANILRAYNGAIVYTFWPALALFLAGFLAAWGVEWVSVKGKKIEAAFA